MGELDLGGVEVCRHPGAIAEAGLLASVKLPRLRYGLDALIGAVAERRLSDLQVEGALGPFTLTQGRGDISISNEMLQAVGRVG